MRVLLLLFMVPFGTDTFGCSCAGIATVEETIKSIPILAIVKVKRIERGVHGAKVEVVIVLKGNIESSEIGVGGSMYYASITPSDMKIDDISLSVQQAC